MPTAALAVTENTADSTVVWLAATPEWYAWFLGTREYTSTVSVAVLAAAGLLSTDTADSSAGQGIVLVLLDGAATETTADTTADAGTVAVVATGAVTENTQDVLTGVVANANRPAASGGGHRMRASQYDWQTPPTLSPTRISQLRRRRHELLLLRA